MTTLTEAQTLQVIEGSTADFTATLVDDNGNPVPLASLTSLQLTYEDDFTGTVINSRQDQDVLNTNNCTFGVTDGLFTWHIQPEDTVVLDSNLRFETHSAILTWVWSGGSNQQRYQFYLQVENVGKTCWKNFIDRVSSRLGRDRRNIELADEHWCEAISQSMDLLNTYLFRPVWANLGEQQAESLTVKFGDLLGSPDTYDANLRSVVRVIFHDPNSGSTPISDDPFLLTSRLVSGAGGYLGGSLGGRSSTGRYSLGDIALWQQRSEISMRLAGNDPDWLWDEANRQLVISMPSGRTYDVTYLKAYSYTPNNLPSGYFHYFLKSLEGFARIILADIRGKFGQQIPGPTGGIQTDASVQREKGEALINSVEDTLKLLPLNAIPEFG